MEVAQVPLGRSSLLSHFLNLLGRPPSTKLNSSIA
ncbi:hypothetical protein FOXG_18100 [Fusarium oxysporum f. sp. lycopersici 4287]|uniref:Uncharacterized protein n=1 Tax=Fusarium oxysporum f. sp. lycopersici (strain 4287 / CBS 123668 / FGSC 9935 / NRRL 34936) TaxID=426428 RepID=A0A0J9UB57_FUSO4|nr:hypothetical protein FOXG_18100 [Fusarium oxysporum f. sp. lycopersici 4287]KNA96097.1 hypothetical protein FOXG_18100 [Fusarium oxysporum f. sp. lycopersici 4287]